MAAIRHPEEPANRPPVEAPPRTPERARRTVLKTLMDALDASAAAFVRIASATTGATRVVDRIVEGNPLTLNRLGALESHLLESGGRPQRRHLDTFAPGPPCPNPGVSCVWAVLTEGDRVLGLVVLGREPGLPEFDSRTLQTVNRTIPKLRRILVAAGRRERATLTEAPFHVIVDIHGEVMMATPTARAWLAQGGDNALRRAICEAGEAAVGGPTVAFAGGAEILLSVVSSVDDMAFLATISRTSRLRLAPDHQLTPRQREVAEYAAAGATVPEIARTLDISKNTVKHHLKEVYRLFEVASRVELRDAMTANDDG